jgi:beta-1,4-mannosyl-glycoprotein beta-1,4-N-acetylglucosaminyltransferase
MIIDTTLFNNEFDMLDIRLALTQHYVDRWVICEGNRTMSGRPKPYYLSENIERYAKWGDRIRVVKLDVPESWTNWDIENGQRAALLEGYSDCNSEDIVMHSDLDEMINPELWNEIVALLNEHDKPITCTLDMFIYKFDQQVMRKWAGNVVARRRMFEEPCKLYKGLNAGVGHAQKKKDRGHCVPYEKTAGWHWGWMGSDELLKTKAWSCIETQHRDADQMVESFRKLDAAAAINHKTPTQLVDPQYPAVVNQVLQQYPYWTGRG